MATTRNEGFLIMAPEPVDARSIVSTYFDLASVPIKYDGLVTYVKDEQRFYFVEVDTWKPLVTTGQDYDDSWIQGQIDTKVSKTGDDMTGSLNVLGTSVVRAANFILNASTASYGTPLISSSGWQLWTDNNFRSQINPDDVVQFIGGTAVDLDYDPNNNTITINAQEQQSNLDTEGDYTINGNWVFSKDLKANNFILNDSNSSSPGTGYAGWDLWVDNVLRTRIASNDRIDFVGGQGINLALVNNELTINAEAQGDSVDQADLDAKYDKTGGLISGDVEVTGGVTSVGEMSAANFIIGGSGPSVGFQNIFYTTSLTAFDLDFNTGAEVLQYTGIDDCDITVKPDADFDHREGTKIRIINSGGGDITLVADTGVSIGSLGGGPLTFGPDESRLIIKIGIDNWFLIN